METDAPASAIPGTPALHAHLGFWLRLVSNQVSGRFARLLEDHGSSVSEWVALCALAEQHHTTHATLVQALGMTKGAASKIVTRLEEKGLARRQPAKTGARGQTLQLTRRGRALLPKLAALADQNEAHFFGHLAASEHAALMNSFRDLVRHHGFTDIPTD